MILRRPFSSSGGARSVFIVLALVVGFLATGSNPVSAQSRSINLSPEQRNFLTQAEAYLNHFHNAQARFIQQSSTGERSEGTLSLNRPNRMRLEYNAPTNIFLVANGSHLIYVDNKLEQVTHIPLESTPLGMLLKDKVSFSDPSITLTDVRESGGVTEVTMIQTKDPGVGSLTLVFTPSPLELRQWRVLDAQGIEVAVSLFNLREDVTFDPAIFTYRKADPRRLP